MASPTDKEQSTDKDRNPWMKRRVIAYAHQGGAWEYPSSTLLAIRRAVEAGATAIELDVHATADGHLVVCHDGTVDRTTNGRGAIAALTLAQVQALDNAYWFIPGADVTPDRPADDYLWRGRAPEDPELRIATLHEVLDAFPDVVLNLDIKSTAPTVLPYEETLARLLADFGRTEDVIVASFHDVAIESFSRAAPDVPTSAGMLATGSFWRAVQEERKPPSNGHVALQVPTTFGAHVVVDDRFVDVAHAEGLAVHVWTIEEEDEMERLIDLEVDGIITDRPTVLADVLARRNVAWQPGRGEGSDQD